MIAAGCASVAPSGPQRRAAVTEPPAGVYAVVRVIDGDTLVIAVPLADGNRLAVPVRLLDVDTPERGQPDFDRATDELRRRAGPAVRIAYDGRTRDRYGRLLARLWAPDSPADADSINAQLAGLGWPDRYAKPHSRKDR